MKKLQSKERATGSFIFPVVGKVTFDAEGFISVEDKDAPELLKLVHGLVDPSAPKPKEQPKKELKEPTAEDKPSAEDAVEKINGMKKAELIELLKSAEVPEEQWSNMKVAEMKELLIAKIS